MIILMRLPGFIILFTGNEESMVVEYYLGELS